MSLLLDLLVVVLMALSGKCFLFWVFGILLILSWCDLIYNLLRFDLSIAVFNLYGKWVMEGFQLSFCYWVLLVVTSMAIEAFFN
jgi:hypothetical protein